MSQSLKIYTLGRLTIELDGKSLSDFVSQKAPALFLYLLHHPREHERDVLAELFWSDTSSEQALKNLRTVLSNLQKSLGAYLEVNRQTLAIAQPESIWLDSHVFSHSLAAIHERQQQPHSPRRLLAELDKALDIYQGDFLLGLKTGGAPELDTWLSLERESLRGKLLKALYLAMELALAQGDYGRGIGYGGKLLALDPFYERGLRLQMRFHAYADNRNAALQAYDSFAKLLQKELEAEPEEETMALAKAIKVGRIVAVAALRKPNNLYRPTNRYTGNASLIAQANSLLDEPNCRLVTFLGAGGIGKTRLAEHIAHERLEDYRDGIFFVPLASVNVAADVIQAVFQALGILYSDSLRKPLDALLEALRDKQLLLIMDNFEHVLEAADLIAELLRRLPFLQILATSREALQLQDEYLLMMQTLAYPRTGETGADMAALELFAQMAQRVQLDFSLEAHASDVAEICRLVDGLPLAIVIAAAWVQFLSPGMIAQRILESLDFLSVQRRDMPERHQGIAALLHSSWQALSPKEQQQLQALAVFAGNFDLEAATAISGADAEDLNRLVSKSLLQIQSEGRYQQHELLRRFVLEQGENPSARLALAHYFRDWAKHLEAEGRPIHEQFALIDREYANLWRLEGLSETEQQRHILSLCGILPEYWIARGYAAQDGIRRLEQALNFAEDKPQYVRGLVRFGQMLAQYNRYEEARQLLPEAIAQSHELGDTVLEGVALNAYQRSLIAFGDFEGSREVLFQLVDLTEAAADSPQIKRLRGIAYTNLGTVHNQLGFMDEAVIFAQIGLELNEQTNNVLMRCLCHNVLGIVALERADYLKARNEFSEALQLAKEVGHIRFETMFSGNLAEAVQKNGDLDAAYRIYCDTLLTAYRIEHYATVLNVLEQMANLALELGLGEASGILWGAAKQLRGSLQLAIEPRQEPELNTIEAAIKDNLGEFYAASLEKGRKLGLKEAVDYARTV
jgi:predicted ATPase/DNA-binding SARP family transcriptional activator